MTSPEQIRSVTRDLMSVYPIGPQEIVQAVLRAWESIESSSIGPARIGRDIFPSPQVLGLFLHEIIPLEMRQLCGDQWRGDETSTEKDLVYLTDDHFSTEIKTSSSPNRIFANRSYGRRKADSETLKPVRTRKSKSGYYWAVNFSHWPKESPGVRLIRVGWLDAVDWMSQDAQSGQQASLPPMVENNQLLTIYRRD